MKMRCKDFFCKKNYLTVVSGAVMAALCACDEASEKVTEPAKATTEATVVPTEEPETETSSPARSEADENRDLIYDMMVYGIVPQLANPNSPLAGQIKEILRLLNEQYELEKTELAGTSDLARLAILIADMRRSFGAWDSALKDYDRALADFNAMADIDKADDIHTRWLSNIYYGKAYCYMQKQDLTKAMEQYDLRLANDEKRASTLPEFKPGAQVSTQVVPIVHDLISSLRTKAECQAMSDPEEAKTSFSTAIERAEGLLGLPDFSTHRQYLMLLISAANHSSRCNDTQKAKDYCMKMMKHCEKLHNGTNDVNVRQFMLAQIKQGQEMYKQLEAGQTPPEEPTPAEITTEPINAELPPLPTDAPAEAPETTTVTEAPAVSATPQSQTPQKTTQKNKRRRR
ncbi:MAG: hypothetical protein IKV92_01500 [Akkermansia sp.]|nr:hypothetical protein [Akkermansia sp.]